VWGTNAAFHGNIWRVSVVTVMCVHGDAIACSFHCDGRRIFQKMSSLVLRTFSDLRAAIDVLWLSLSIKKSFFRDLLVKRSFLGKK